MKSQPSGSLFHDSQEPKVNISLEDAIEPVCFWKRARSELVYKGIIYLVSFIDTYPCFWGNKVSVSPKHWVKAVVECYTYVLLLLPRASSLLQYCYTRLSLIALNYRSAAGTGKSRAIVASARWWRLWTCTWESCGTTRKHSLTGWIKISHKTAFLSSREKQKAGLCL